MILGWVVFGLAGYGLTALLAAVVDIVRERRRMRHVTMRLKWEGKR